MRTPASPFAVFAVSLAAALVWTASDAGPAEGCAGAYVDRCALSAISILGGDADVPPDQGFVLQASGCFDMETKLKIVVKDSSQASVEGVVSSPLEGYLVWRPVTPLATNSDYVVELNQAVDAGVPVQRTIHTAAALAGALPAEAKVALPPPEVYQHVDQLCCPYSDGMSCTTYRCVTASTANRARVTVTGTVGDPGAPLGVFSRKIRDSSDSTVLFQDVAGTAPVVLDVPPGRQSMCVTFEAVRLTDGAAVSSPSTCVDVPAFEVNMIPACKDISGLIEQNKGCYGATGVTSDELKALRDQCAALSDAGAGPSDAGGGPSGAVETATEDDGGCSMLGGRARGAQIAAFLGVLAVAAALRRSRTAK